MRSPGAREFGRGTGASLGIAKSDPHRTQPSGRGEKKWPCPGPHRSLRPDAPGHQLHSQNGYHSEVSSPPNASFKHLLALALLLSLCGRAVAQLPIHSDAAVQPSAGHFLLREQFMFGNLGRDPTGFGHEVREYIATTDLTWGVTPHFALRATIPVVWQSVDSDVLDHSGHGGSGGGNPFPFPFPFPGDGGTTAHPLGSDFGIDDITVGFKWRVYERDFCPIDTLRFAII